MANRCSLYRLISNSRGDSIYDFFNTTPPIDEYADYMYYDSNKGDWIVGYDNIIIGFNNGKTDQQLEHVVSIGYNSGNQFQSNEAIAIGYFAGQHYQGTGAISIGLTTGNTGQAVGAIAIGENAGANKQSIAVAIGKNAGLNKQQTLAIAIGYNAGAMNQPINAIAIGKHAGEINQPTNAIAIGLHSGQIGQNPYTVSIGTNTGLSGQSSHTISIGSGGANTQVTQSVLLNASTDNINTANQGCFINPIRGPVGGASVLSYNSTTKEITFTGSSKRYKHDIMDLTQDTENIYKLQPREFKYRQTNKKDIGLIAEEANKCDPMFAYKDKDGIPEGIQWNVIHTYLIAEMKKLKMRRDNLRKELDNLYKIQDKTIKK
jgi:hypothetical protein